MKLFKLKGLFFNFLFILCFTQYSVGQSFLSKISSKNMSSQYQSLSIGVGTSHYYGDLSPYSTFYYGLYTNVRWNASLNYTHYLTPDFGLRFGFTWARLAGDDFNYSQRNLSKYYLQYFRNLSFRNDVKEFSVEGVFNLVKEDRKNIRGREKITPYAFVGLGLIAHNPQARLPVNEDISGNFTSLGKWVSLKSQYTAGQGLGNNYPKAYSTVALVVPVGLGIRYKLNQRFDVSAEVGFRFSSTDYLDDVSNDKYPADADLAAAGITPLGLSERGSEMFAANSGKERTTQYQWIFQNVLGFGSSPIIPSQGTYKAHKSSERGAKRLDSYLLTQFSIHYVLSTDVKCPPIR